MILGSPWQKANRVYIDCAGARIRMGRINRVIHSLNTSARIHNEAVDARTFVAQAMSGPVDPRLMTTKQANKAINRGAKYLLVNVRDTLRSISLPPERLQPKTGDETNPPWFPQLAGQPSGHPEMQQQRPDAGMRGRLRHMCTNGPVARHPGEPVRNGTPNGSST